jgi:hypothetical protein
MDNPFKDCPLQGEILSTRIIPKVKDQNFKKECFIG